MNALLFWTCCCVFAGLPPWLLARRFARGRPAWLLIVLVILLLGWASWVGIVSLHFEVLGDRMSAMKNPPPELVDESASDGGPKTVALLFGWAFALAYAAAWYLVYLLALFSRRMARTSFGRMTLPPAEYRPPGRRL